MISYCGIPLPLNTPELDKVISEGVDLSAYRPIPKNVNDSVPPGFLRFQAYEPPAVQVGRLTWPSDLNAYATGYYLVTEEQLTAILNAPAHCDLILDDGTNRVAYEMFIHTLHPVAQNAYLMVMVDKRFGQLRVGVAESLAVGAYVVNKGPTLLPVSAADPLGDLEIDVSAVGLGGPYVSDPLPDTAYSDLYTPYYRRQWLQQADVIPHRHGFLDSTHSGPAVMSSPDIASDTDFDTTGAAEAVSQLSTPLRSYSITQLAMNSANMLGYRICVTPGAFDTATYLSTGTVVPVPRIVLKRSDLAGSRDVAETTTWESYQKYGKYVDLNSTDPLLVTPFGTDYPRTIRTVGLTHGAAFTAGAPTGYVTPPIQFCDFLDPVPWLASVDIDLLYSTNYTGSSSYTTALGTRITDDYWNWRKHTIVDLTYHGIVTFDFHGTVYEVQHTHTDNVFHTKVCPYPRAPNFALTPCVPRTTNFFLWSDLYQSYDSDLP